MKLTELTVKKALNKAYRLLKPKREQVETFKAGLIKLLDNLDEKESEENVKIHLMDFLKETFHPEHLIATKGKTDFVIHTGKEAKTAAGVMFEVKKPTNKADMVSRQNLNAKAMHELLLYYLRERLDHKNNNLTHLVITNIYEWFIFDAQDFERLFFKNTQLKKDYEAWLQGQKTSTNTDLFYKEIARPFLAELTEELSFTYFNLKDYEKPLRNSSKTDDNQLIGLLKILSPTHLLKLPFTNDSNSLDKGFYAELLHLIGLEEVKEGNKKLIRRKPAGKRNEGSLLENVIVNIESEDRLHMLSNPSQYGATQEERLFNVGLELCITWVNRILFLKLLEAQLIKYHRGDKSYKFLNFQKIPQYDELNKLFFQVLARKPENRSAAIQQKYAEVPYLNSSLFEPTQLEDLILRVSGLDDLVDLELYNGTVLRDKKNKPVADKLNALQYLFDFLEAYDFASEGGEEIQEESKTLINASVLGLIFEKINGYRDGSIYTPGFITMYMCRQAIRLAVLQKFTERYGWNAKNFEDLPNYLADHKSSAEILEFNQLVNSLRICDPAVGSGHFLVSALNELIAVKAELGILADKDGKRLTGYEFSIENDELLVTSEDDLQFFSYEVTAGGGVAKEKQRVQQTLFHEKQTLIESCLFGVDINPNSVKICRLRLWIELLKNAYYKTNHPQPLSRNASGSATDQAGNQLFRTSASGSDLPGTSVSPEPNTRTKMSATGLVSDTDVRNSLTNHPQPGSLVPRDLQLPKAGSKNHDSSPPFQGGVGGGYATNIPALETLPNIDINIKQGNSLISRFALDADLSKALKNLKYSVSDYRDNVAKYKNAQDKEEKRKLEDLIAGIKSDFRAEITKNDPKLQKLQKLQGELYVLQTQTSIFEPSAKEKKANKLKQEKLEAEIKKLSADVEAIKSNAIYRNAFEWRFEFPEVLDNEGNFEGFDVVIGNPPYISSKGFEKSLIEYLNTNYETAEYQLDLYVSFIERGIKLLKLKGLISYITPNSWLKNLTFIKCRKFLLENVSFTEFVPNLSNVFEEASVDTLVFTAVKDNLERKVLIGDFLNEDFHLKHFTNQKRFKNNNRFTFDLEISENISSIFDKINSNSIPLEEIAEITRGVNSYDKYAGHTEDQIKNKVFHASFKNDETFIPELRGKHVSPYSLNWDNKHFISYGNWLAAPRDPKFFNGDRIIMRQVLGQKLFCTIIREPFIIDQSVFIAKLKESALDNFKIEFVLGLLASKLQIFYFKYSSNEFDALFPKIKIGEFRELPIANASENEQKTITALVDQILSAKQTDPQADTSAQEQQIDQLVYQLYHLTPEEIAIVEGR